MTQEIAGGSRRGAGTGENTAAEGVVNEDNEFILEFGGFANANACASLGAHTGCRQKT
jgi:hypothetical protein